jgi:hypothetical protein
VTQARPWRAGYLDSNQWEDLGMSMGNGGPLFGSGGYYQPQGPYGPWAGCGCSSIFIILAGILLVMGGCLRMFGQ